MMYREVNSACLEIILFPFGEDAGDDELPVLDDVASDPDT